MIGNNFVIFADRILGLGETDELSCDFSTLMHQLIETVLSVRPWFTENDWAGFDSWVQTDASLRHSFTIAFHLKLLDMRWESQQCLAVRQYSP